MPVTFFFHSIRSRINRGGQTPSDPIEIIPTNSKTEEKLSSSSGNQRQRSYQGGGSVETAQDALQEEVTYRPRLRRSGNVHSSENVELTANRHSGGSSSLNSEARSESRSSSAHDSTDDSSPAATLKISNVGESVVWSQHSSWLLPRLQPSHYFVGHNSTLWMYFCTILKTEHSIAEVIVNNSNKILW